MTWEAHRGRVLLSSMGGRVLGVTKDHNGEAETAKRVVKNIVWTDQTVQNQEMCLRIGLQQCFERSKHLLRHLKFTVCAKCMSLN